MTGDAARLLRDIRDRAPGKDGLPLQAWRAIPGADAHFTRLALLTCSGVIPMHDWNWALGWFPPKKILPTDFWAFRCSAYFVCKFVCVCVSEHLYVLYRITIDVEHLGASLQ